MTRVRPASEFDAHLDGPARETAPLSGADPEDKTDCPDSGGRLCGSDSGWQTASVVVGTGP